MLYTDYTSVEEEEEDDVEMLQEEDDMHMVGSKRKRKEEEEHPDDPKKKKQKLNATQSTHPQTKKTRDLIKNEVISILLFNSYPGTQYST